MCSRFISRISARRCRCSETGDDFLLALRIRHQGNLSLVASQGGVISEQLLDRIVQRFRGGLSFEAHRLLYDSTLGVRVMKKKKKSRGCATPTFHGSLRTDTRCQTTQRSLCAPATRWTTTLSPKVNLHHAIKFRSLCGSNLVTYHADLRGDETRVARGPIVRF